MAYLFMATRPAYAADGLKPTPRFNTLSVGDGLASNGVTAMIQDNQGFIWLGTYKGLSRHDGYSFKNFYAKGQLGALSDDYIRALYLDATDTLWVATHRGGLNRYDKQQQTFANYQHQANDQHSLSANSVRALLGNDDGTLWVGTSLGLDLFDSQSAKVLHHFPTAGIRALLKSATGQLWLATEAGIYLFNDKQQQFTAIELPGLTSPSSRALLQDDAGNIWIATTKGLFKYDITTEQILAVDLAQPSPSRIVSLTQGSAGSIWAGSTFQGLYHISADNKVAQYRYDKGNQFTLADDLVLSLLWDAGGVLWAGTFDAGVSRVPMESLAFGLYHDGSDSVACLPSAAIYSIYAENGTALWLGTDNGLVHLDTNTAECKVYRADARGEKSGAMSVPRSVPYPNVKAIYRDDQGQLWLGLGKGLAKYDGNNDSFNLVGSALSQANINFITQDNHQRLLVATISGLYMQNPSGDFSQVAATEPGLQHSRMYAGVKDKQGKLWLATDQGLAFFDPEQQTLKPWAASAALPIRVMVIDESQTAWLGSTDGGLYQVDLRTGGKNKVYDLATLHLTAQFNAIVADDFGFLWLSTSHGLLRYHPQTAKSHLFRASDGLQSDNFFIRSAFKTPDGQLIFGGRKGFNRFYPQNIRLNPQGPKVALTAFHHFNQLVEPQSSYQSFQLPQAIGLTQQLDLSHRDYVFGFEFSAFDYADSARNLFAYKLDGFDQSWNYTDATNRRVTYTNLSAGQYTFRLKAANKDGLWNERGSTIKLNVAPAPWATPWAYAAYVLTLLGSFGAFYRYRTAALNQRAHQLQLSVDERTAALNQEKHTVEQLLAQKNDEFANVSHEFRTPLTLVLGPVGQLLNSDISDEAKNKLTTVKRNGFRLLRMVDQLLQMEKFKVQQTTNKSVVALRPLLDLMGQSFQDLATAQQIELTIEPIAEVYLHFTQDGLEKIMLNLLSNALKYTPAGGHIQLRAKAVAGEVRIEVADSGIGIAKDQQQAVFERFVRVMDARSEKVTGAGIGLALVKELVTAHQGKIDLHSELGQGTTIAVILPTVNADSSADKKAANSGLNQELIALELESFSGQIVEPSTVANVEDSSHDDRPSLLIIEDNPDMRHYIYQSLSGQYQCVVEANGKAGVERAYAIIPDIIVSDVMMPIMDGYEVTKAIKSDERTSHIPVILLTARDDKQSRLKGWLEKADEYLTKPFDTQELLIRIDNLLAIRDILRDRFNQTVFEQPPRLATPVQPDTPSSDALKLAAQQAFLSKINDIIELLYTNHETTVPDIAKRAAMGNRQLFRKLKGIVDMSPSDYLRRYRLEKSCQLLRQGMKSSTVALEVGFASHSYFTRCFSAQYGCAPSQFIEVGVGVGK
ncbi:MAG: ligand-binding sensor domain-containing protein/signal transduction histidine kinase [Phenylobacterium sp.]|jgi:ligand-binding sensor domain-containing protein/signal transduction histidine kinase/DNA-binding NarL/FixJ family response regulator